MAKGKGGKSSGAVSNGVHSNVAKQTRNAMRRAYRASGDRLLNQMAALKKGKDVVLTIDNPNKNETNKRRIKVRVTAAEYRARFDRPVYRDAADA